MRRRRFLKIAPVVVVTPTCMFHADQITVESHPESGSMIRTVRMKVGNAVIEVPKDYFIPLVYRPPTSERLKGDEKCVSSR